MILSLLAVSLNDQALTRPITARFDAAGGTIGRADHSTLALPDPERFISRKQAEIVFVGDSYMIRNVGAANPITVAQRTLAAGEAAPLRHGDEVRIGGYLLRAECRPAGTGRAPAPATVVASAARAPRLAATPLTPAGPVAATLVHSAAPAPLSGDNPFADLLGPGMPDVGVVPAGRPTADDPFADLLGGNPYPPPPPRPGAAPPPTPRHGVAPPRSLPASSAERAPAPVMDDPFAGLMPAAAGLDPALGNVGRSRAGGTPARLPDDFDPFATAGLTSPAATPGRPAAPAAGPAKGGDDPFADLLGDAGGSGAASIDKALGLAPAGDDPLARFAAQPAGTPAAALGAELPTDPLLLFGSEPAARAPVPAGAAPAGAAALPDHVPALNAAYTPPRVAPGAAAFIPPTVVAPVAPVKAMPTPIAPKPIAPAQQVAAPPAAARPRRPAGAAGGGDAADALWRAFCDGAGVDLPVPPGDAEARMRHIGRILRSAVEGTLQLISVRASTKHEMRAVVTQIQATSNNPLKFSPDAASGIEQLLTPPQRGFMDGVSAMDDAMLDLVGHSIGTVAGMRAAIEGMLDRFDPASLEGKLGAGSLLANLLPMNRKARLWELYLQHHRSIRDEAEEDFHTLFGRAFVAAYEQQVDRLERQRQQQQRARR